MAIRYTVTTSSCPHCGHVLKREGYPIGILLLMICTAFLALLWYIAIPILNKIFNYESVKMGSPYIRCPHCNKLVRTNEAFEWGSFKTEYKKNWAFRNWMRTCYALGGLALFSLFIVIMSAINNKPGDVPPIIIFSIILVICLAVIGFAFYKRKQYTNDNFITVSEADYEEIKASWRRLKSQESDAYEKDTIKISSTGKVIKPSIQSTSNEKSVCVEKEVEETIDTNNEEDSEEIDDEYDESLFDDFEDDEEDVSQENDIDENETIPVDIDINIKKEEPIQTPKPNNNKSQEKHIIVARKKKN